MSPTFVILGKLPLWRHIIGWFSWIVDVTFVVGGYWVNHHYIADNGYVSVLLFLIALILIFAGWMSAPSTPVQLTAADIQLAASALANAGAACDAGAKIYCTIPAVRDGLMAKLQTAFNTLSASPPAKK